MQKSLTIHDIAKEAGVSIQTVSRVLNNRPDVSRETRKRVQDVIARNDYQPNAIARSLIRQRTHTIGFIGSGLGLYGPGALLMAVEQQASQQGYSLLPQFLHHPVSEGTGKQLKMLLSQQVDGIIWSLPVLDGNSEWLDETMIPKGLPMLTIGSDVSGTWRAVDSDEHFGVQQAVDHLLQLGKQRIGMIGGAPNWKVAKLRYNGWYEKLTDAQLLPNPAQFVASDWTAEGGNLAMQHLMKAFPTLDAVFVANDQMALGALCAIQDVGLRIPEDIAVIGFDNFPESAYFFPPLSTIQQPWSEISRITVRELTRMIEEKFEHEDGHFVPPQTEMLIPDLIVRRSTAAG